MKLLTRVQNKGMGEYEERNSRCFFRSLMSVCDGVKTRVRVDLRWSEDLEVEVLMQQRSVLSSFFAQL